jgi:hypothetical protein
MLMRPPDERESRPGAEGRHPETAVVGGKSGHSVDAATDNVSALRRALEDAIAEEGGSLKDFTVLAAQNDPFRVDTPAGHRDGEWLAVTARELGICDRRIHLRGLHYMLIGRPKPDGTPYTNTERDWLWLSGDAGKAARFLGYLPFGQIVDQRNDAPTVTIFQPKHPWKGISVGLHVDIPDVSSMQPRAYLVDFTGTQPYKIILVGEKSSLTEVLGPIAERYGADLYLPTGEISDTLIHQMAKTGAEDGRPMTVLYFSDCDPAGWQMPISVARKLQAFQALLFPDLRYEVHRVALMPDQVREYGLPSTPLKDTERRADSWQRAMRVRQTEIDALAALRPDLLRRIARDAVRPFHDSTLSSRVYQARLEWIERAQAVIDAGLDSEHLERIRVEATANLEALREQIDALNNEMRIDASDFDLPPVPPVPEVRVNGHHPLPLLDSRWSFVDQVRRLKASKEYRDGGGPT